MADHVRLIVPHIFISKTVTLRNVNAAATYCNRDRAITSVIMYVAHIWSLTVASQRRLDAFDQWCLKHILRIPHTAHVNNSEVRSRTGQRPITALIKQTQLKLIGHVARADQAEDHSRAL